MKRVGVQIMLDVLKAVEQTSIPSHVMYKSRLSWATLMSYLSKIMEIDLIRMETETRKTRTSKRLRTYKHYYLTKKGKETLNHFRRLIR